MKLRALILATICCITVPGADSVQEFRLPNGLRVLLVENHERPLVRLELRTAWDPSEEPAGKEGLGGVLAEMLATGRKDPVKREAFQRFLEDRALRLSFSVQSGAFAWSVLSDSQGQDGAFESLTMAATRSDFDGTMFEVLRQSYFKTFRERTPRVRAEDRFRRRVGDPHLSLRPEEGSLGRIAFQDLLLLSRRVLRPERSVLVIQGDVNLPQAKQLSMLHLGAWGPSAPAPVPPASDVLAEQASRIRTVMIPEPGAPVRVRLGSPAPDGTRIPPSVLALCGWLVKRELTSNLPPPLAKAEFEPFSGGAWMIEAAASPGVSAPEAMEAVRKLLQRLREKGIEADELATARTAWSAARRSRSLHPKEEAAALAERALRSEGLEEGVDSLGAEDLQDALRRLFSEEACLYFVVGGVSEDALRLAKAGFGPVETIN